jgi:hypothetical protein
MNPWKGGYDTGLPALAVRKPRPEGWLNPVAIWTWHRPDPPKKANRDPAYGALADLGLIWQAELEEIVGRHVSLEHLTPGTDFDVKTRSTGTCLWSRSS